MRKKTTPKDRERNRLRAVVYYRQSTDGGDGDSVATQKEIIGKWAAENHLEIVEEVIDCRPVAEPSEFDSAFDAMFKQHVTMHGDMLYVLRMDASRWRRWRRSDMALQYRNLSKSHDRRVIFVTTAKDTASHLSWLIHLAPWQRCTFREDRARNAAAWRRAAKTEAQGRSLSSEPLRRDKTVDGDGTGQV